MKKGGCSAFTLIEKLQLAESQKRKKEHKRMYEKQ